MKAKNQEQAWVTPPRSQRRLGSEHSYLIPRPNPKLPGYPRLEASSLGTGAPRLALEGYSQVQGSVANTICTSHRPVGPVDTSFPILALGLLD